MFSDYTSKNILNTLKEDVNNELDTREGSITFDALSPFSKELAKLYIHLNKIYLENFIQTSNYENTVNRAYEMSVKNKKQTKAKLLCEFNTEISIGDRFIGKDLTYTAIKKKSDFKYILECDTYGQIGNYYIGKIKPIIQNNQLTYANIMSLYEKGKDKENISKFKQRYFKEVVSKFFTGSIENYKNQLKENNNGYQFRLDYDISKNLLNIIVLKSNGEIINQNEINQIKETIETPIMQQFKISSALEKYIDFSFSLQYENGYTKGDIEQDVYNTIDNIFKNKYTDFEVQKNIIIRKSEIEIAILNIIGVKDIFDLLLNGKSKNIEIPVDEIALRGDVFFD